MKERKGSEVIALGKLRFSYHLSLKYHASSGHVALQVASLQIMAASVIFLARFRFEFPCNCQPRLYNLKLVFVKPCVGATLTLCACLDFCSKDEWKLQPIDSFSWLLQEAIFSGENRSCSAAHKTLITVKHEPLFYRMLYSIASIER